MNIRVAALVCLGGTLVPGLSAAEAVFNADTATLQTTLSRDGNGFSSCGVRAVVLVLGAAAKGTAYDFSISIYPESVSGMIKVGRYDTEALVKGRGKTPLVALQPAPTGFWIAGANEGVPLKVRKYIPADTSGFTLGGTDIVDALHAMLDMARGERMQFQYAYPGKSTRPIISFTGKLAPNDMDALMACTEGVQKRLEGTFEKLDSGKKQ
jgi:hypothetical protein